MSKGPITWWTVRILQLTFYLKRPCYFTPWFWICQILSIGLIIFLEKGHEYLQHLSPLGDTCGFI